MAKTKTASERRTLKKYLSRYFKAKEQLDILRERQQRLHQGPEASESEARLQAQAKAAERCVLEVMDILEQLPQNSTERIIMELRHLDCKPWAKIQETVFLSASPCFDYYNRGLDALLAMDKVRRIIGLSKK